MKTMNTPRTRAEFERNFHLLHQKLKDGKMHFSSQVSHAIDCLMKVRFLPNGRVDFLSVDESARLQANMMDQFDEESLEQIQKEKRAAEQDSGTKSSGEPNT